MSGEGKGAVAEPSASSLTLLPSHHHLGHPKPCVPSMGKELHSVPSQSWSLGTSHGQFKITVCPAITNLL